MYEKQLESIICSSCVSQVLTINIRNCFGSSSMFAEFSDLLNLLSGLLFQCPSLPQLKQPLLLLLYLDQDFDFPVCSSIFPSHFFYCHDLVCYLIRLCQQTIFLSLEHLESFPFSISFLSFDLTAPVAFTDTQCLYHILKFFQTDHTYEIVSSIAWLIYLQTHLLVDC